MPEGVLLVTGAAGFVGRRVCTELLAAGFEVRGLVRGGRAPDGVRPVQCSGLDDERALRGAVEGVDAVVHLAARAHIMRDPAPDPLAEYRRVNVEGTRLLLDAVVRAGVPRFVLVSSVKAVGSSSREPWTSATPARPDDPYGVSKREAEQLVEGASSVTRTILRLPLVYGPGVRANMLQLLRLVNSGIPLPLGGIRNLRSQVFVGNVAAALRSILVRGFPGVGPFFLTDGPPLSTPELVGAIGEALGRPARIWTFPPGLLALGGRLGDLLAPALPVPLTSEAISRLAQSLVVDGSEFAARVGHENPYTVREGLHETARWFLGRDA